MKSLRYYYSHYCYYYHHHHYHNNNTKSSTTSSQTVSMTNSSSIQMEDPGQEPKTLSEKLQSHYRNGSPGGSRGTRLVRALFVFQVVTQLYVTLQHLLPFVFQGFNPWVLYCLKVFACYLFVMGVANWLCVICYG